jgi:hypothetical protein
MARSIGDVPNYTTYSTQPNLTALPFKIQFLGGTINTASGTTNLPFGVKFSSKTGVGVYRFVVPATVATKFWVNGRNTGNLIMTFPNQDTLVPTGFLDIQMGTTAATTATDPADGVILYGTIFEGWGR